MPPFIPSVITPGASNLPQGGPQVLGANLNRSESKRARWDPGQPPPPALLVLPRGRPRDGWDAASLEQNSQSGPIKADAFAGLEHCGDDAWDGERAADALHCPGIAPELFGNHAHTGPARSRQGLTDSLSQGRGLSEATRGVFPHP
jgi:hypothetical protein